VKRTIAACFAGALLFAGVASAATPAQRITKLEKQVGTLTKTINTQKKQIKQLQNLVVGALYIETCLAATTADALQSTWTTLDQAAGTNLFGPQQTISDSNTCNPLQITRQGIRTPPTPSVFSALTALVNTSKAFRLG
jgi:outer membrane murein-binding lipoprotein Lpp